MKSAYELAKIYDEAQSSGPETTISYSQANIVYDYDYE